MMEMANEIVGARKRGRKPVDVAVVYRPSCGGCAAGSTRGPSLARWLEEAFPVGFVEDGDDAAQAARRAMAGDFFDLEALDGHGKVVLGDVIGEGLVGVVVQTVRRQPCGQESRVVGAVMGLAQGLQRTTDTRQGASASGMSLGWSR